MLGGASSINGVGWVRGNRLDYDRWARLGCRGWSWEDVLPLFKAMEDFPDGDDDVRGKGGPIRVTTVPENLRLYRSFFEACHSVGIDRTRDHNGHVQTGAGMTQVSVSRGRRMSTAATYLKVARRRPNLQIETGTQAQRLILRNGRCIGVRIVQNGRVRDLYAAREVIVSAGAIASPQLLEVSGVGQADRLGRLGIPVVADLAGVGEGLRDHWAPRMKWQLARRGQTFNELARGLGALKQGLAFLITRSGFLTMPAAPVRVFAKSMDTLEQPDFMFVLQPFLVTPEVKLSATPGIQIVANQLRPESQGSVHAISADIAVKPQIRFNFLSEQVDRDCLLYAMRLVRRVMAAPAMRWLEPEELSPGWQAQTDSELLEYVAQTAETAFHPVGTCKMGHDRMAVVDEALRVHGVDGLRVADASIMPTMVSGNTNAPAIMIGEKAALLIRAAHG